MHIGISISQNLIIWLISRARPFIGFTDLFSGYQLNVIDVQHIGIGYNLIIGIGKGYLHKLVFANYFTTKTNNLTIYLPPIFRFSWYIIFRIFILERDGSQWVLNWTEGCCEIPMGPRMIEMVIMGSENVKLQFWVVRMV